ncbi:MAG: hypothetical protein AAFR41_03435 [Pseudomonadota bacterium]
MATAYYNEPDRKPGGLRALLGPVLAMSWIGITGSITYGAMLYTGLLPEELRVAALDQILYPDRVDEDALSAEEELKIAGMNPEDMAMMVLAAQTVGDSPIGLAASDVLEEYDEEAFELMTQMELKGGTADYQEILEMLPTDVVDTTMTEEEAMNELEQHAAFMMEMQSVLNEAENGTYDGPIDGMHETGEIETIPSMMATMVDVAQDAEAEGKSFETALATENLDAVLKESGFLENPSETVKAATEQALQAVLDEQRYTVPMLDLDTTDFDKISAYTQLARDPESLLNGTTEESVAFVRAYLLPHTLMTDAVHYRESGETERALNTLRLIFSAFPEHKITGDALLLLSDIQDTEGETEASRRSLQTFLSVHGGHPRLVDGVLRYTDWTIASGDGLPAACRWLAHVSAYPPALRDHGRVTIRRAAEIRGCIAPAAGAVAQLRTGSY